MLELSLAPPFAARCERNEKEEMLKAVLFDLDDTIFDHQHARRAALGALQASFSALANQDVFSLEVVHERFLQEPHSRLLAGEVTLAQARLERLRGLFAEFGVKLSPDQLAEADVIYRKSYNNSRRRVPGVFELISFLAPQVKIGVITNGLVREQQEKLVLCGVTDLVDTVVVSEAVGAKKPNREIFDYALGRLQVRNHEAIMIGDFWSVNVLGAHAAGISAIWFNRCCEKCLEPEFTHILTTLEPIDHVLPYFADAKAEQIGRGERA